MSPDPAGPAEPRGDVQTAAIVGVNWGLVHLRGLREAGCDVVALAAANEQRAREVAERERVALGTSRLADLSSIDLVVIATPAPTHAAVIAGLPEPLLVCEKPLLGAHGGSIDAAPVSRRLLVNYAFSFLGTAKAAAAVVAEQGPPDAVELDVGVNLPHPFTAGEWVAEAASHPLSWLVHLFGTPRVQSSEAAAARAQMHLDLGGVQTALRLDVGGEPGIRQRVVMAWGPRRMVLSGSFAPGLPWRYAPLDFDGERITEGEWSPTDCWMDANAASIATMLRVYRGQLAWREGLDQGLFDADKALTVDSVLAALGPDLRP